MKIIVNEDNEDVTEEQEKLKDFNIREELNLCLEGLMGAVTVEQRSISPLYIPRYLLKKPKKY